MDPNLDTTLVRHRSPFQTPLPFIAALELLTTCITATGWQSGWTQPYGVTLFGFLWLYIERRLVFWVLLGILGLAATLIISRIRQRRLPGTRAWGRSLLWLIYGVTMEVVTTLATAKLAQGELRSEIAFPSLLSYMGTRLAIWVPLAVLLLACPGVRPKRSFEGRTEPRNAAWYNGRLLKPI